MNANTARTPTGDGEPVFEHGEPIHAAGATVTVQTMHEGDHYQQHVIADLADEPLTAANARELAAALLGAADGIDGRDSEIAITPATLVDR